MRWLRNTKKRPDSPANLLADDWESPTILHGSLHLRRDGHYCRGRVRNDDTGQDLFDECVATKPLMASLCGSTNEAIMTCSCGEPGCAGFWQQESCLSGLHVHWFLHYKKDVFDILFDREGYENEVLSVLAQFRQNPWEDRNLPFGTVPSEYPDFTAFVQTIDALLSHSSRFAEKWATLCPLTSTR